MNTMVDEKIDDVNWKIGLILEKLSREGESPRIQDHPKGVPIPNSGSKSVVTIFLYVKPLKIVKLI